MSITLGNGNITFGDATVQSTAGSMLGVGQSWTNVTASRAFGTTYTNSTGKTIMVAVSYDGNADNVNEYVNGSQIGNCQIPQTTYSSRHSMYLVPPGSTYLSTVSAGQAPAPTLHKWYELR